MFSHRQLLRVVLVLCFFLQLRGFIFKVDTPLLSLMRSLVYSSSCGICWQVIPSTARPHLHSGFIAKQVVWLARRPIVKGPFFTIGPFPMIVARTVLLVCGDL
jgi:hypothetical protein